MSLLSLARKMMVKETAPPPKEITMSTPEQRQHRWVTVVTGLFGILDQAALEQKNNLIREYKWHMVKLTEAMAPPKPTLLANPSALANMESSEDQPLYMSGRDGKIFFEIYGETERVDGRACQSSVSFWLGLQY